MVTSMAWEGLYRDARGRLAVSFALYSAITLVLFRSLLPHIADGLPHDAGDPALSAWALWWNARHVPFMQAWWDGMAFYPEHGSVAFSDHRVGLGLIASPILWLGGGPVLAHNVVFLLSFPLCAIAAHLLARDLTGSDVAGFIAGVTFGFNPYRMDHLPHLELLAAWWLPIVFLALHRYVRDGQARWLALFSVSLALQGLSGGYYFFFAAPLIAAWIMWFVRSLRQGAAIAVAWAAAVIPLLPALLGYRHFLGRLALHRDYQEIRSFSADITGLLSGSPLLAVWHSLPALHRQEGDIFVGVFAAALVAGGVLLPRSPRPASVALLRRVQLACLVLAVLFEAAALSSVAGGWSVRVAGAVIAVHDSARPASTAAALLALAGLTSAAVSDGWRRRSALAFYAVAAILMWLCALGPVPSFLGERALYRGPYGYLMSLPGFYDAFRVPARFAMMLAFALAAGAALAFARVTRGSRAPVRRGFGALMAAGVLLDGWITALPVAAPPPSWAWPAETARSAAVLELPIGGDLDEIAAVWRTTGHGRPVINGYSGYDPPHHRLLRRALARHDSSVLKGIAEFGPILIALDPEDPDFRSWRAALVDAGATAATADGRRVFLALPRTEPAAPPVGIALPVVSGSANRGHFVLQDVTDGNRATRWVTQEFQRGDEEVVLQLDGPHRITGVVLSMAIFAAEEYPRRLRVETSLDGRVWNIAIDTPTSALAFGAVLRDALNARLTFRLPEVDAGYVRLRQMDADRTAYWSITDVEILGR